MIILQLPSKSIEILNLKRVRNKIIEFEKECWRISYQDDKLYVVVDKGIVVLDLSGHILDLLPIYTQKEMPFATTKDRIYFTNPTKGFVHCISLTGQELIIREMSLLQTTRTSLLLVRMIFLLYNRMERRVQYY